VAHQSQPEQLIVFKYADEGVATQEDGLYATETTLKDAVKTDRLARFLKASAQGWQFAVDRQDEAVKIVMENDTAGAQTAAHQKRMMGEIAKLVMPAAKGLGYLDEAAYTRTVEELMSGMSEPVITRKPEEAWTHGVWDEALGK